MPARSQRRLDRAARRPSPAIMHQQPHRGQDGGALELAARMVGADPEHVDADDDADRRQHAREIGQDAVRVGLVRSPGRPPQARSGASDQTPISAMTSTIASSSVSIARNASSTRGDRVADPGGGACWRATSRRERRRRIGQRSTQSRERGRDRSGTAARPARVRHLRRCAHAAALRCRAAAPRTDQQRAGQPAADCRFGQRHVDAGQAAPRPASAAGRRP